VFAVEGDDPMALIATTAAQRAERSIYSRTLPLLFDPPPDTMFMRGTGLDLAVFGEDLPDGHLQMIDGASLSGWVLEMLVTAVERDAKATTLALVALSCASKDPATSEEVATALGTGVFPGEVGQGKGAILQAAAFAHHLLAAGRHATPVGASVVWEFTGGRCSYDYP
jgi:hypothetical protein